jgi:hypothetical protein
MARSDIAPDLTEPELHIGFRRLEQDDDDWWCNRQCGQRATD